jgi:hypothetical protein
MGGIVECGVSTDTKDSPRRVAIEKAQEELRYVDHNVVFDWFTLSIGT